MISAASTKPSTNSAAVAADPAAELRSGQHAVELGEQRGADHEIETLRDPGVDNLAGWSARRDQRGYQDVRIEDDAHARTSGSAPTLAPHLVQLAVGERERLFRVQALAGVPRLPVQGFGDALSAAGELHVAFVRQDDGLGPSPRADDDRFGVDTFGSEASEQRRKLRTDFASCQHVVRLAHHPHHDTRTCTPCAPALSDVATITALAPIFGASTALSFLAASACGM